MSHMQAQLQRAASLFFDRLPSPVQQQLVEAFRSMDANGDGRISLAELVRWASTADPTSASSFDPTLPVIFAFVDADRNGTLDFNECKGLFFIGCTTSRTCDGCGKLLLESAYTCVDCSLLHSVTNIGSTFDLCSSCYAIFKSPLPFIARNPKLMHPHRNMVEQESGLVDAINDMLDQVQCAVCKEYHRSTAQGVFTQRHVHVGRGPREMSICEWCIACVCSACGNHFQGPRETAASGRWAMQGSGTCIPCKQRGIMQGSPFAPAFSAETLQKMDNAPVFEECSTCKAKIKDGSLTTTVLRAIITPRGGMFGGAPNPYGYNMPNMFGSHIPGFNPMSSFNALGGNSYGSPSTPALFGGGNGNSFDGLTQMFNNGAGCSTGNPFDMLNMVNNTGSSPLNMLNMGSTGSPLDVLNMVNNMGSSPLEMVGNMGNALDMLTMVSSCSIM